MVTLELGPAPAKPLSLNEMNGMHWADRRRRTDPWKALALYTAMQANLAAVVNGEPCCVTVRIPVQGRYRRDPHNYVPVAKAVVDGLVKAGVWPDDNPTFVTVMEPVLVQCPEPAAVTLEAREL